MADRPASPGARNAARRAYTVAELEELNAAADAIEQTINSKGWSLLMQMLEQDVAKALHGLDRTPPPGRAEFARAHGRAAGLFAVRDKARALIERRNAVMAAQAAKHENEPAESGARG